MTGAEEFDVIYADPPWSYDNRVDRDLKKDWGGIDRHYPTMPLEDICALPVPSARNAVLYLWGTAPPLPNALTVMRAWGFDYRSNAVWDKTEPKIGYWFRGQHEHLLIGVKGQWSPPDPPLRVPSVYREARGKHSRKPDAIRSMIAAWWPNARRLEMFCRYPAPGWAAWGNQVDTSVADLAAERFDPVAARQVVGQVDIFGAGTA